MVNRRVGIGCVMAAAAMGFGCAAQADGATTSASTTTDAPVLHVERGCADMPPGPRVPGVVRATAQNTTGNSVMLAIPCTIGTASMLLVTQVWNAGGQGGTYNNHHVGVWQDGSGNSYIYNQDLSPIPLGAAFNYVSDNLQVVTAAPGKAMTIGGPSNLGATWFVTSVWNPYGGMGVYDNHQPAVIFDGTFWSVAQSDGSAFPAWASFNANQYSGQIVTAGPGNVVGDSMYLSDPSYDGNPNARVFVTENLSPKGLPPVKVGVEVGVWYDAWRGRWAVFTEDGSSMPLGATFNVVAL
jgi:hypothetical protein